MSQLLYNTYTGSQIPFFLWNYCGTPNLSVIKFFNIVFNLVSWFLVSVWHRCPRGRRLVTQGSYDLCENINECLEYSSTCIHGNCHDTEDGYYCHCFHGYTGPDCSIRTEMAAAFISTSAMLTIIGCAVSVLSKLLFYQDIILLLVLLMIVLLVSTSWVSSEMV